MFGQSLLSAFGSAACTTDTDQLFDAVSTQLNSVQTYKLDGNATSISGTNNGSESNISWVTGKFGQAASFSSSSIGIGNLIGGNVYTYSFWVKPNSIASGVYGAMIGSSSPDVTYYQENSKLSIYNGSGSSYLTTSNIFLNTTDWVNIVAVATGSQILIYRNGVLSNTFNDTPANSQNITFGKHPQYSVEYYSGLLDQVRIFNSALTQAQVTALYNETASTAAYGYITYDKFNGVAYYKMSNATDQLGNYNGTATNVNFNTEGKFGFAGAFNGSSSGIDTNYTVSADSTMSFSVWFNTSSTARQSIFADYNSAGAGTSVRAALTMGSGTSNDKFEITIGNGSSFWNDLTTDCSLYRDGAWHNIVVIYNGTSVKLYADGNSIADLTSSVAYGTAGTQSLVLGKAGDYSGLYFNGKIDQVRVYDSAISAENVTTLYKEIECPAVAVTNAFNTVLYTGDATARSITTVGFKPDLVWIKNRDATYFHALFDSIRGANKVLSSNNTDSENQYGNWTQQLTSFNSNGFSLGNNSDSGNYVNISGDDYVSWNWKAGGPAVQNTDGTITSQVSANVDAGFSIVKWTTTSAAAWNVGHGLSTAPEMIISKTSSFSNSWEVYHKDVGTGKYLLLQSTAAVGTDAGAFSSVTNTTWTSYTTNTLATYIAYCFHSVDGYSKINSYEGGTITSSNPVYLGFRPAFVMFKTTQTGNEWLIYDSVRDTSDPLQKILYPSSSAVEGVSTSDNYNLYTTSSGFYFNNTVGYLNNSASDVIFMAIA